MRRSARRRLTVLTASLGVLTGVGTLGLALINRGTIHNLAAADPIGIIMAINFVRVGGPIGAGLTIMRVRREALGGSLRLSSHPGEGSTLIGRVAQGKQL